MNRLNSPFVDHPGLPRSGVLKGKYEKVSGEPAGSRSQKSTMPDELKERAASPRGGGPVPTPGVPEHQDKWRNGCNSDSLDRKRIRKKSRNRMKDGCAARGNGKQGGIPHRRRSDRKPAGRLPIKVRSAVYRAPFSSRPFRNRNCHGIVCRACSYNSPFALAYMQNLSGRFKGILP